MPTCVAFLHGVGEQGRRDSNPQPPVLETGALPIELLPSGTGLWAGSAGVLRTRRPEAPRIAARPSPTSGADSGRRRGREEREDQTGSVRRRARAKSTAAVVVPAAAT